MIERIIDNINIVSLMQDSWYTKQVDDLMNAAVAVAVIVTTATNKKRAKKKTHTKINISYF